MSLEIDKTSVLEFPPDSLGRIPDQVFDLPSKTGQIEIESGIRVRLIVQMFDVKQSGKSISFATIGMFAPIDMSDDESRWAAERLRHCFNNMGGS